ncbi:hypothetical protein KAR10_08150 [bacterium]|nr:hypothetical protein [bacterium]
MTFFGKNDILILCNFESEYLLVIPWVGISGIVRRRYQKKRGSLMIKKILCVITGLFMFSMALSMISAAAEAKVKKAGVSKVKKIISSTKRPEVSRYARVYKGDELTVTTVRFGPKSKLQILVLFEGIDHEWDGKIMIHQVVKGKKKTELVTTYNEEKLTTLVFPSRSSWWRGYVEAYLPGFDTEIVLGYVDEASKEVKTQHFLTRYLDQ